MLEDYFSHISVLENLFIGLILDLIIGYLAYKKKALTFSGVIAAISMGMTIFFFLNINGWILLAFFFISCTICGKISQRFQNTQANSIQEKGECRDQYQVFANGGIPQLCSIFYGLTKNPIFIALFGASLAESTSDTFASEIGILSKKPPVSILTWKPVLPGISGGITFLGSFGAFIGSFSIAIIWYFFYGISNPRFSNNSISWLFVVGISGFLGNLVDSISGASFQALYWDDLNNKYTEKPSRNGHVHQLKHGFHWANNDLVNLFSNFMSALICLILIYITNI